MPGQEQFDDESSASRGRSDFDRRVGVAASFLLPGISLIGSNARSCNCCGRSIGFVTMLLMRLCHPALGPIDRIAPPVQGARSEATEGRATAARCLGAKRCRPDGIAG